MTTAAINGPDAVVTQINRGVAEARRLLAGDSQA